MPTLGSRIVWIAVTLLALCIGASASAGGPCTDGTNCYCDRVGNSGSPSHDGALIWCEDFEDAAFYDDVPGAWYQSPPGNPGFRGGGSLWMQRYRSTNAGGEWRNGQPANPKRGSPCAYGICGPAEWRADDLWDGNYTATIDVQRNGDVNAEIPDLTLDGVPDGQQYMGWRIRVGHTTGTHGRVTFAPATEIGYTAAMAYSSNIGRAFVSGSGFPAQAWKHMEWGGRWTTLFMGNVGAGGPPNGVGGQPFSPAIFKPASTSQAQCNALLAQATFEAGSAWCSDVAVSIRSNFDFATEWGGGQWACVRGHVKGLGTTNGSLEIWFNNKKVFSMKNANLQQLFFDQSINNFVWNTYYNGNGGMSFDRPTVETAYRYTDNVHVRRGPPVSCSAIGMGSGQPPPPPSSPPAPPYLLPPS